MVARAAGSELIACACPPGPSLATPRHDSLVFWFIFNQTFPPACQRVEKLVTAENNASVGQRKYGIARVQQGNRTVESVVVFLLIEPKAPP